MKILKSIYGFFFYYYYLVKYFVQIHLEMQLSDRIKEAKLFALFTHHSVRQSYDYYPYYFHVLDVAENTLKYAHLIETNEIEDAYIIALLHDVIEDCRLTYNDVKKRFGKTIADGVYACTEERGRNRDERHGEEFFNVLAKNKLGTFVKLNDNMRNANRSIVTGHSMLERYQKEYPKVKSKLYREDFKEIFDKLEKMLF